jgi:hypothetical protein
MEFGELDYISSGTKFLQAGGAATVNVLIEVQKMLCQVVIMRWFA